MSEQIHPLALCESTHIGDNTKVMPFAHIAEGAHIGRDCVIGEQVFIENDVVIGDRVIIHSGVQLWDGLQVEDDVFIGPNATFTNERFPRAGETGKQPMRTRIESGASIGANATVLPGLVIGSRAMIGAGAVVTRNVPPGAIVVGNPGRIVGYEGAQEVAEDFSLAESAGGKVVTTGVSNVTLHRIPQFRDIRGSLSVSEFASDLPFQPKRFFLVYDVPGKDVRGEHAHRECSQFLVCISGSVHIVADDGRKRQEFILDSPSMGLSLPPLTWGIQYKYSSNAILLVLASHAYDAGDYIRDYGQFLKLARSVS